MLLVVALQVPGQWLAYSAMGIVVSAMCNGYSAPAGVSGVETLQSLAHLPMIAPIFVVIM